VDVAPVGWFSRPGSRVGSPLRRMGGLPRRRPGDMGPDVGFF